MSLFLWAFILGSTAYGRTIYVNKSAPGPVFDGQAWATAFQKVGDGIAAASATDEVRVAAGVYEERITLKNGVAVRGGYAGSGSDPDQRDVQANATILDGSAGGTVVTIPADATTQTVLDGFTIRNGLRTGNGGGVSIAGGAPVLRNNTITGNRVSGAGGGIVSTSASPLIENNVISNNASGGDAAGISSTGGAPVIRNNVILRNATGAGRKGGGIVMTNPTSATVASNTIVANSSGTAGGLYVSGTSLQNAAIASNIVAFNGDGGIVKSGTIVVSMTYNCVFANVVDITGFTTSPIGVDGNISANPRLADVPFGNVHLQPDSPCRDSGDDAAVVPDALDMDGQDRKEGNHTDIGADESYGETHPRVAAIRVSTGGNDNLDGTSWANAKRNLRTAVSAAVGGEVWVAAGEYKDRITMQDVAVYGGFAGTETARDQRNPRANVTALDGSALGAVVAIRGGATALTVLDGFTIRNGKSTTAGGGVAIGVTSLAAIRNNIVTGNISTVDGGGVYFNGGAPVIECNVITGNKAGDDGGGIYGENGTPLIRNNLIAGNEALSTKRGGGIIVLTAAPTILHNTIVGNTSATGGGILLTGTAAQTAVVANNVIAFNTGGGISRTTVTLTFSGNVVFGNGADFTGVTPGAFNIVSDPRFADMAGGDYHLKPISSAIDWGNDSFVSAGLSDLDGSPRIQGLCTDAGAYEFAVTATITFADAVSAMRVACGLRVSTPEYLARLDVVKTGESIGRILLDDVLSLARTAAGRN